MKVFSKEQIYEGDRITIKNENINSADLMERAGRSLYHWFASQLQGAPVLIHIFCGVGNNGGDGLVLARHLIIHGYNVKSYIVDFSEKRSKDFLVNYERLKETTKDWPISIHSEHDFPKINPDELVVDAVFGIGLNRPLTQWVSLLFQHFKASQAYVISVDIPSGLFLDRVPRHENEVVHANLTLTFQSPKLVFLLPETGKFTEQWQALDIGIDSEFLENTETEAETIDKIVAITLYKPRTRFSHKGTFGHTLIIGGSYGKIGAVQLAAKAALTSGSGLVTTYVPKCGYIPLQSAVPEVMVETDLNEVMITNISFNVNPTVIGIGVGLGTDNNTLNAFESFLETNTKPLIIDADGLNLIARKPELLQYLKEDTILTPHPKELERLIGTWKDDFEKLEKAKAFSLSNKVILIIKGAYTTTVYQEKLYINTTGNPGLATAGTGDVLTGIISGLLAQGYHPLDAALFGVYLHGKSADIAIESLSYENLIASDVIKHLGAAYLDLFAVPEIEISEGNQDPSK